MGIASRKYFPSDVTDEYEILTPMGKSDRWETYRIIRRSDEKDFVLTVDRKFPSTPRGRRATGETYIALRRVKHPAFPVLKQIGLLQSGGYYLIREFIRGVNLRNLGKHLDFPFLVDVLAKLLPPLHLLHLNGFVHGRITPEKIIVSGLEEDRTVHLVDHGLPAHPDHRRWSPPAYRAPEWNSEGNVDGRADLYSIAVLAYELMAGRHPFPLRVAGNVDGSPQPRDVPPLKSVRCNCPPKLDEILLKMGLADRRGRLDTAQKCAHELGRARLQGKSSTILSKSSIINSLGRKALKGMTQPGESITRQIGEMFHSPTTSSSAINSYENRAIRETRKDHRWKKRETKRAKETNTTEKSRPVHRSGEPQKESELAVDTLINIGTITEKTIWSWIIPLCNGPIERKRASVLAKWLTWKARQGNISISNYLVNHLQQDDGEIKLNWAQISKGIILDIPGRNPKSIDDAIPREFKDPLAASKTLRGGCLPIAAAKAIELNMRQGKTRTETAKWCFLAATCYREGGLLGKAANLLMKTAELLPKDKQQLKAIIRGKSMLMYRLDSDKGKPQDGSNAEGDPNELTSKASKALRIVRAILRARLHYLDGELEESRRMAATGRALLGDLTNVAGKEMYSRGQNTSLNRVYKNWARTELLKAEVRLDMAGGKYEEAILKLQNQVGPDAKHAQGNQGGHLVGLLAGALLKKREFRCGKRMAIVAAKVGLRTGSTRRIAAALTNIAYAELMLGNHESMKRWMPLLVSVGSEGTSSRNELRIWQNVSAFMGECYDYVNALRFALRGLRRARAHGHSEFITRLSFNIGMGYKLLGQPSKALQWMDRAFSSLAAGDRGSMREAILVCSVTLSAMSRDDEDLVLRMRRLAECVSDEELDNILDRDWHVCARLCREGSWARRDKGCVTPRKDIEGHPSIGSESVALRRRDEARACSRHAGKLINFLLWMPIDECGVDLSAVPHAALRLKQLGEVSLSARLAAIGAMRFAALGWLDYGLECVDIAESCHSLLEQDWTACRDVVHRSTMYGEGREASELIDACLSWMAHLFSEMELMRSSGLASPVGTGRSLSSDAELINAYSFLRTTFGCMGLQMTILVRGDDLWSGTKVEIGRQPEIFCVGNSIGRIIECCKMNFMIGVQRDGLRCVGLSADRSLAVCVMADQASGIGSLERERVRRGMKSVLQILTDFPEGSRRQSMKRVAAEAGGCHRKGETALSRLREGRNAHGIVFRSEALGHVMQDLEKLARMRVPIIIVGESGTGKEHLARWAHHCSGDTRGAFVAVDCPGLCVGVIESELFGHEDGAFSGAKGARRGLLEHANGGTLFLDEVGDLALAGQAKLLRALSCGEFRPIGSGKVKRMDVFTVSATNVRVKELVESGRFRSDLFYRLGIEVYVPPLRDRCEDIVPLWEHFLEECSDGYCRYEDGIIDLLLSHEWRGNVRELKNCVHAAKARCGDEVVSCGIVRDVLRGALCPGSGIGLAEGGCIRLERGLRSIESNGRATRREYARCMGVSARTALRDLDRLLRRGLLRREGNGRGTVYYPVVSM